MEAKETTLRSLLNGSIQFVVPLFQRTYAWKEKNWRSLWADIVDVYDHGQAHFLGPLVTKHWTSTPEGVAKFLLIDGQQRLTTLSLLLAAVRDLASAAGDSERADRIGGLHLTNQFVKGDDRLKVLPTQADRAAFTSVVDANFKEKDPEITGAYEFFAQRLAQGNVDGKPWNLAAIEKSVLDGLELVSIKLGASDNEYRIFESLNGKGVPLAQADLLRNYLFMRLPGDRQDEVYEGLWLPMQKAVFAARGHQPDLEAFFRYALMARLGQFVREDSVFADWRTVLEKFTGADQVVEAMKEMSNAATRFVRLIAPAHEPEVGIREALKRLNRWGGQTMYPFLLNAYEARDSGAMSDSQLLECLSVVESFLVRRLFCRVPTNTLNRMFATLWREIPEDQRSPAGLKAVLSAAGKRWPKNEEFVGALRQYPLYTDSRPDQRKIVLERLDSWKNKEAPADYANFSIEHIMPQGLTEAWREHLGADHAKVHERYLHVLGNLTLTAYNPELSNNVFHADGEPNSLPAEEKPRTKRQWFSRSGTRMSQELAKNESWTADRIEARSEALAAVAIEIWPGPTL